VSTRLGVDGHVACTTGHYAPRRGQVAGRGPCKLRPHRAGASLRGGHAAPNQGERARAAPPRHNRELGEAGGHGRAGGHHAGEGSGLGWARRAGRGQDQGRLRRVSHPVLEGKPNTNHVRARIRTHIHNDYIIGHHHTMLKLNSGKVLSYIKVSETSTESIT
jgi:hypothetical protein